MTVAARLNARRTGVMGAQPVLFVHGFGCDQSMWKLVSPAFEDRYEVITIDLVGAGGSDPTAWDAQRYSRLDGYASDIVALVEELDLHDVVIVGHSVSAMIAAIADVMAPARFSRIVMIGPSPRYVDDGAYVGGFTAEAVDDLLASMASNYLGWSAAMAPVIVGNPARPELGQQLTEVFCRMDPAIARVFARTTFLSDARHVLPLVTAPTLVMQCAEDVIAPEQVGRFVAEQVPQGTFVQLRASGHCPNLSAPGETIAVIRDYLQRTPGKVGAGTVG